MLETSKLNRKGKTSSSHQGEQLLPKVPDEDFILLTFFLLFSFFFPLVTAWKDTLSCVSPRPLRSGEVSSFRLLACHQRFQSVHDAKDPLVLSVTNFSSFPNVTANYNWLPQKTPANFNVYSQNNLSLAFIFLQLWVYGPKETQLLMYTLVHLHPHVLVII